MDNIELTKYGFSKYDSTSVESLFEKSGLTEVVTQIIKELELEFEGKII